VGACLGVAVRAGLEIPDTSVWFSFMLANFVGTATLSLLTAHKSSLQYGPLFVGAGTGLCGALTTFSSWQQVSASLVLPSSRLGADAGQLTYLWIQVQVVGMAVNAAGWVFGSHLAVLLEPSRQLSRSLESFSEQATEALESDHAPGGARLEASAQPTQTWWQLHARRLDSATAIATVLTAGAVVSATVVLQTALCFALCWGPFGAWSRWRLGKLNAAFPRFPAGTFLANIVACALLGGAIVLGWSLRAGSLECRILQGFVVGFCGALSTVSTFVSELNVLSLSDSYRYGVVSVLCASGTFLAIVGGAVLGQGVTGADLEGSCTA